MNDDFHLLAKDRLSSWEFLPSSPYSASAGATPDEKHKVRVYKGPPRVLEIGCADGGWCFTIKSHQPDWIIEGLDDTDQWSKSILGATAK